jgi:hypothetical protein
MTELPEAVRTLFDGWKPGRKYAGSRGRRESWGRQKFYWPSGPCNGQTKHDMGSVSHEIRVDKGRARLAPNLKLWREVDERRLPIRDRHYLFGKRQILRTLLASPCFFTRRL